MGLPLCCLWEIFFSCLSTEGREDPVRGAEAGEGWEEVNLTS